MKRLRAAIASSLAFAMALTLTLSRAQGLARTAFVAEAGVTTQGAYSLTAGVAWPLAWHRMSHSGEWTASAELFASRWRSKVRGRRETFIQLGLVPVLRYRFDRGRSDWFAEGGIGVSYLDGLYRRDDKQFSTRFNFYDALGVGRSFGAHREHELGLRLVHVSNAGLKKPNPGENFLQVRYAHAF